METEPVHKVNKAMLASWLSKRLPELETACNQAYLDLDAYIKEYGASDAVKQALQQNQREAAEARAQIELEFANQANWDHSSESHFNALLEVIADCRDRIVALTDEATSPSVDESDTTVQPTLPRSAADDGTDSAARDKPAPANDTTQHLSLWQDIKEYTVGINGKPPLYKADLVKYTDGFKKWHHSRTEGSDPERAAKLQAKRAERARRKAERLKAQQEEYNRHGYGDITTDPADN